MATTRNQLHTYISRELQDMLEAFVKLEAEKAGKRITTASVVRQAIEYYVKSQTERVA